MESKKAIHSLFTLLKATIQQDRGMGSQRREAGCRLDGYRLPEGRGHDARVNSLSLQIINLRSELLICTLVHGGDDDFV